MQAPFGIALLDFILFQVLINIQHLILPCFKCPLKSRQNIFKDGSTRVIDTPMAHVSSCQVAGQLPPVCDSGIRLQKEEARNNMMLQDPG